jgi:flagellar biosynthesis protein FliP
MGPALQRADDDGIRPLADSEMIPPRVALSLPFKLIFLVLVDGWSLGAGSLIHSHGP